MSEYPVPPPLPAAPALTLAAADQWRAARVWRRLETWRLVLLPVVTVVLAVVFDRTPERCGGWQACTVPYAESLGPAVLVVEFLVLLLRPRGSFAVPAAAGLLLWLLPDALPGPWLPTVACAMHLAVAAALYRVAAGRRRARAQLDTLMGPPVPYPWTPAGGESPLEPPSAPRIRQVLAALLGIGAVVLLLVGVSRTEDGIRRAADADQVRATVRSVHDGSATVAYRLPHELRTLTAEVDGEGREVGDRVPLLVDGTGWTRAADEWQDSVPWWIGVGAAGTLAALLGLSAHRTTRYRRADRDGAPAMRVRALRTAGDSLVVLPVDGGDREAGLWQLVPAGAGSAHYAPADADGPAEWLYGEAGEEETDEEDEEDEGHAVTLAEAAARVERSATPFDVLLYQGPDSGRRQLVVYRSLSDPYEWRAGFAAEPAVPPKRRAESAITDDTVLVKAEAARQLEQDLAEQPDARPEPAQVFGLPARLRCGLPPLAAVLIAVLATFLADGDGITDRLLRPVFMGGTALIGIIDAFGWQLGVDRDGVRWSGVVRTRRLGWQQVTAAAVLRGRFVVRGSSRGFGCSAGPAGVLHKMFGGPYSPEQMARTVSVLANRPERRPPDVLPDDAVGRGLLLNRLTLGGYLVWAVGQYVLR